MLTFIARQQLTAEQPKVFFLWMHLKNHESEDIDEKFALKIEQFNPENLKQNDHIIIIIKYTHNLLQN